MSAVIVGHGIIFVDLGSVYKQIIFSPFSIPYQPTLSTVLVSNNLDISFERNDHRSEQGD